MANLTDPPIGPDGLTATDRVKAAISANQPPRRADVERSLREIYGMSKTQARWFAAEGTRALDPTRSGATAEALERLRAL